MHIKTDQEIKFLKESGRMLATVLNYLCKQIQGGLSTHDLALLAAKELEKLGGKPAFLNYNGFPSVICISVNDEVVHGIPGNRLLKSGDIVGLDFGVNYRGMITDSARSIIVDNKKTPEKELLITKTAQA